MNITEVKLGQTKNLGSYESERIDLTAALEEGDDVLEVLADLRRVIEGKEPLLTSKVIEKVVEEKAPVKEVKGSEEPVKEEPTPEKKKAAPKKETGTKKKAKAQPYDRELPLHRQLMGETLDEVFADWRSNDEIGKKARTASREFVGKDFLDSDGKVVDSFKAELKEFLGV